MNRSSMCTKNHMRGNVWSHLGVKSWIVLIKATVKIIFILPNKMDWLQHPVSFYFEINFFHLRSKDYFGIHQQIWPPSTTFSSQSHSAKNVMSMLKRMRKFPALIFKMAAVRRLLESRHVYTQNEWLEACISFVKEDNEVCVHLRHYFWSLIT